MSVRSSKIFWSRCAVKPQPAAYLEPLSPLVLLHVSLVLLSHEVLVVLLLRALLQLHLLQVRHLLVQLVVLAPLALLFDLCKLLVAFEALPQQFLAS